MLKWLGKWIGIAVSGVYFGAVVVPLGPGVLLGPARWTPDHAYLYAKAVATLDFATIMTLQSFSYYVEDEANGNASSNCTLGDPCTFYRALAVAACGTNISVAAGIYNHPSGYLNTKSCTSVTVLHWYAEEGVYFTGLYEFPSHLAWSTPSICGVSGTGSGSSPCSYVRVMDFDEVANGWSPIGVGHHETATGIPDIHIAEDYFCMPEGPDCADNPIVFEGKRAQYRSIADILDLTDQHGMFYFDSTTNKLYIHKLDDSNPNVAASDAIGIIRNNAGAFVMDGGDWQSFHNFEMQHAQSSTYCLQTLSTSTGITFTDLEVHSCAMHMEGVTIEIDGLEGGHQWKAGFYREEDPAQCTDANASFGFRECWVENGKGDFFGIGPNVSGFIVRNAHIKNNWGSGMAVVGGANILAEDVIVRDTVNHLCGASSDNAVISGLTWNRIICVNGQESAFVGTPAQENYQTDDWTVTNSFFAPNAFFGPREDFMMFNNIFQEAPAVAVDDDVDPTTMTGLGFDDPDWDSDCNVVITSGSNGVARYPDGPTYTFAQMASMFSQDEHSINYPNSVLTATTTFEDPSMNSAGSMRWPWDVRPDSPSETHMNLNVACSPTYAGPYAAVGEAFPENRARIRRRGLLDFFLPPLPALTKEQLTRAWFEGQFGKRPTVKRLMTGL